MSERLTPEEIERLREADECWDLGTTGLRAVREMLRLHDLVERLRRLQAEDVTDEQRAAWWASQWEQNDTVRSHRTMIAAAVRVIVASLDKNA